MLLPGFISCFNYSLFSLTNGGSPLIGTACWLLRLLEMSSCQGRITIDWLGLLAATVTGDVLLTGSDHH